MAYLSGSTHFNNWIFSDEEVALARRLGLLKAKRALRLEREQLLEQQQQQAPAQAGNGNGATPVMHLARKPRSFAALLPASSTAERDANDANDATDVDVEQEEEREEKQGLQLTPLLEYLTPAQEALLRAFYEEKIVESCSQQFLRTSDKVRSCAVMLFKRFYLSNSVMEFHPKFLVPTAIYVAGKVEEQYMSVDTVADQLRVDHAHIIGHEMVLLEGVRFQLIMYHPFRALLGFMSDLQGFAKAVRSAELPASLLQKLHANACTVLNALLLSDLPLTQYPAYLALAALAMAANELGAEQSEGGLSKADVVEFIRRSKFSQGQDVSAVLERLERVESVYREDQRRRAALAESKEAAEARAKEVKLAYKKLKEFHEEKGEKDKKKKKKDKADDGDKKRKSDKKDDKKKAKKHKKDRK